MKYFDCQKEEDNTFSICFTDAFYKLFSPYYKGRSYWNIMYRLWGLMPRDFYHYCGFTYNAYFKPSDCIRHVKMFFLNKKDAENFCRDTERRLEDASKEKEKES